MAGGPTMQSQQQTSFSNSNWIKVTNPCKQKSHVGHPAEKQDLPLLKLPSWEHREHFSPWKSKTSANLRLTQRNKPHQTEMGLAF